MRMEPDPDSHGGGGLATLERLILGASQFLSPVSIPKAHQEASLTL
jgi:hypothetical protein